MAEAGRKVAPKKVAPKKVAEKDKIPDGCIVAESGVYVAEVDCTYKISYFKAGVTKLRTVKGDIIPHHFIKEKVFKAKVQEQEDLEAQEA